MSFNACSSKNSDEILHYSFVPRGHKPSFYLAEAWIIRCIPTVIAPVFLHSHKLTVLFSTSDSYLT